MLIQFLKKMVIALALVFAVQGCAVFIGDDGFHHFHHRHGHGGRGHSSLQMNQVVENADSIQMAGLEMKIEKN